MKSRRKITWRLLIEACMVCVTGVVSVTGTGCVSPFYGTARIEEGLKIDAGIAYSKIVEPVFDHWGYYLSEGIRGDAVFRYGFNDYIGVHARAAIGYPMVEAGLGLQAAYPIGPVTPALQTEFAFGDPGPFSVGFLLGIGKKEWLTLGIRTHIPGTAGDEPHPEYGPYFEPYPIDVFTGIHIGRWNLFAGSQMFRYTYNDEPLFTIGIGYTFGPLKKKSRL